MGEFLGGLAVKDPVLSLLWYRFNLWPGNFHILRARPGKKKKKRKKERKEKMN